jgi:hypothetical protein
MKGINKQASVYHIHDLFIDIFGVLTRTDEVYSIQHYVIKFVSDLPLVGGFVQCPPLIKLIATIKLKYS